MNYISKKEDTGMTLGSDWDWYSTDKERAKSEREFEKLKQENPATTHRYTFDETDATRKAGRDELARVLSRHFGEDFRDSLAHYAKNPKQK